MSNRTTVAAVIVLFTAAGAPAGDAGPDREMVRFSDKELAFVKQLSPLGPVPSDATNAVADNPAAARLGQRLFFETRLSGNGRFSCASCHDPGMAFTDGKPVAETIARGRRNSPTILNVAYGRWFFWDGRADTLWSQALKPIEDALEMAGSRLRSAQVIAGDPTLRREYEALFPPLPVLASSGRFPADARPVPDDPRHPHHVAWTGLTEADQDAVNRVYANLGKTIAAYERQLVGAGSPFDRFVAAVRGGDSGAAAEMSVRAQRGLKLFLGDAGCRSCHHGPLLSDGEFHDAGVSLPGTEDPGRLAGIDAVLADPFNARGAYSDQPEGLVADKIAFLARGPATLGQFKTPSLRNVARTAPYMHQGRFATLRKVLEYYSTLDGANFAAHGHEEILKPLSLTATEIDDLMAFLQSLTDDPLDPALTRPPETPASATSGS